MKFEVPKALIRLSQHRRFWDFLGITVIVILTITLLYLFLAPNPSPVETHRIFVKVYKGKSDAIGAKIYAFVTTPGGPTRYVGMGEIDLSGSGYVEFPIKDLIREFENSKFNTTKCALVPQVIVVATYKGQCVLASYPLAEYDPKTGDYKPSPKKNLKMYLKRYGMAGPDTGMPPYMIAYKASWQRITLAWIINKEGKPAFLSAELKSPIIFESDLRVSVSGSNLMRLGSIEIYGPKDLTIGKSVNIPSGEEGTISVNALLIWEEWVYGDGHHEHRLYIGDIDFSTLDVKAGSPLYLQKAWTNLGNKGVVVEVKQGSNIGIILPKTFTDLILEDIQSPLSPEPETETGINIKVISGFNLKTEIPSGVTAWRYPGSGNVKPLYFRVGD